MGPGAGYLSCSQQPVVGQTRENAMGIPGQKEGMEGEEEPLVRGGAPFPGAPGRKPRALSPPSLP